MRRRRLMLGAALGWAGRAAPAQSGFDQIPAPGPAEPLPEPLLDEFGLDNGLRVLLGRRPGFPLVTARLVLDLGTLLDPPGKAGMAQLAAQMLGKGVQRSDAAGQDAAEIAFAIERLGATLDIVTAAQHSSLALTLASPRLDEGLALLADLARRPSLPEPELERGRAQLLDALKLNLADPAALAGLLGPRLFWGPGPYGQSASPASLARLRREEVLALLRQRLRPDATVLILSGEVEPAQARALAQRHFGGWRQNRMAPPPQPPSAPPPAAAPATLLVDLPGAGQSAVQLLAPFAARADLAAQRDGALANAVLGQGYSSRLSQEVRIRRALSYGASSSTECLPGGGVLSAQALTQHASAAEVAVLMREQILRLAREPVGAAELEARRASLLGEHGRQLETTAGLAALLAEQLARGRAPLALARLPAEWAAVGAAQLQAFAAAHWQAERLRCVVVADLAAAGEGLRRLDPQARVIRAAELDLDSPSLRRGARA